MTRTFLPRQIIGSIIGAIAYCALVTWSRSGGWLNPVQAAPATIRAQVAPLKTAVRQLKSGKWRLTLESTDPAVGRLQKGQTVEVQVR